MTAPHFVRPVHHELPRGSRWDGAGHDGASLNRQPRKSTAPAGLFAPAPEVIREKQTQPRNTEGLSQSGNLARQRPCGTETAAKRHKRNGEVDDKGQITCQVCIDGRAQRRQDNRPANSARPATPGARCGTKQGYDDHLKRGEEKCQPCKTAMADDSRRRYHLRAAALLPPTTTDQCGQVKGRSAHRRRGEKPCNACRTARNDYERGKAA